MRRLLTSLVFLLPPSRFKIRVLNLLGHRIHPTARVGICLVERVDRFVLEENALIGHFNMFRDLTLVHMAPDAQIMMFNWFVGDSGYGRKAADESLARSLHMAESSHVISQHYLDCGGGVVLEKDAWLTGIRSTLLTHAFDPTDGEILLAPVRIEERAVIATSCTLLPGTVVGAGSLVAAGSTLWTGQHAAEGSLLGGVPARRLAPITIPSRAYRRENFN